MKTGEAAWEVEYETADGGLRRVPVPVAYGFDMVEHAEWRKDHPEVHWLEAHYHLRWLAMRRHRDEAERPPEFDEWKLSVVDIYDIRPEAPAEGEAAAPLP